MSALDELERAVRERAVRRAGEQPAGARARVEPEEAGEEQAQAQEQRRGAGGRRVKKGS